MTAGRPRALDLFCCAGGATRGLQQAGFHVTGIDIRPQPRYVGDRFIQADALAPPVRLADFDLIWASPPCQFYCPGTPDRSIHADLVADTRVLLSGHPLTVIENVPQAPIAADLVLDGTMFPDLRVIRRRHFELSFRPPLALGFPSRGLIARGWSCVVGGGRCSGAPVEANAWHTGAAKRRAMGIDWMSRRELAQAIPPAYAEFIGRAALAHIERAAA